MSHVNDEYDSGVTISRYQLEAWAGRPLTDLEVQQVRDALPDCWVPEAIRTILDTFAVD